MEALKMDPLVRVPPPSSNFFSTWSKIRIQLLSFTAVLRKSWWILLLTITIGVCVASWYISQMPPSFR